MPNVVDRGCTQALAYHNTPLLQLVLGAFSTLVMALFSMAPFGMPVMAPCSITSPLRVSFIIPRQRCYIRQRCRRFPCRICISDPFYQHLPPSASSSMPYHFLDLPFVFALHQYCYQLYIYALL